MMTKNHITVIKNTMNQNNKKMTTTKKITKMKDPTKVETNKMIEITTITEAMIKIITTEATMTEDMTEDMMTEVMKIEAVTIQNTINQEKEKKIDLLV